MLLRCFAYDADLLNICCLQLNAERFQSAEYDYGNEDATNYFLIINAGNDNKVLSVILRRYAGFIAQGYQAVIGLRDMYSRIYRELSPSVVDAKVNQEIITTVYKQLEEAGMSRAKVCFAIMEVETWMLALIDKWSGTITEADIKKYFNPNGSLEDIYHPTEIVKAITSTSGITYDKHSSQVNSIMANIGWEDYLMLYNSNRCPSFNTFADSLAILR